MKRKPFISKGVNRAIENYTMEKRRSVAKDIGSDDYVTYLAIENDEVVGFIGLMNPEPSRITESIDNCW